MWGLRQIFLFHGLPWYLSYLFHYITIDCVSKQTESIFSILEPAAIQLIFKFIWTSLPSFKYNIWIFYLLVCRCQQRDIKAGAESRIEIKATERVCWPSLEDPKNKCSEARALQNCQQWHGNSSFCVVNRARSFWIFITYMFPETSRLWNWGMSLYSLFTSAPSPCLQTVAKKRGWITFDRLSILDTSNLMFKHLCW